MIKVLLIPDRKVIEFEEKELRVRDILERFDFDEDDVAVLVNNHLIEDLDYIVKEGDDVKLVRVATGG
ncbi:MoaD/ThiS family protein [Desulfurococcaceae archaeon MEX13E-LK6-19]|nr:MoaD/ThiS family protein [Desulfurococcaceae archaeon MEX13E-LK6-19]